MNDETESVTVILEIPRATLEQLMRFRGHTTIEAYITALVDKDDEALWDEQFAATPSEVWERMASEALNKVTR